MEKKCEKINSLTQWCRVCCSVWPELGKSSLTWGKRKESLTLCCLFLAFKFKSDMYKVKTTQYFKRKLSLWRCFHTESSKHGQPASNPFILYLLPLYHHEGSGCRWALCSTWTLFNLGAAPYEDLLAHTGGEDGGSRKQSSWRCSSRTSLYPTIPTLGLDGPTCTLHPFCSCLRQSLPPPPPHSKDDRYIM